MKIIPSVLLLTFVGFLPNDCDAVSQLLRVYFTNHVLFAGTLWSYGNDPVWLENPETTRENFEGYEACVRLSNGRTHYRSLGELAGQLSGRIDYRPIPIFRDYNVIPISVKLELADTKYVSTGRFQRWTFANPLPTEGHFLFITIPRTMHVYYIQLIARGKTRTDAEIKDRLNQALKEYDSSQQTSSSPKKVKSVIPNRNSAQKKQKI